MTVSENSDLLPEGMGQHDISASWKTLMRQAGMTAGVYMSAAIEEIDATFGKGYAKQNSALVAGFMQAAALDFHASSIGVAAQRIRDALESLSEQQGDSDANIAIARRVARDRPIHVVGNLSKSRQAGKQVALPTGVVDADELRQVIVALTCARTRNAIGTHCR